jgi:hypothetical protein
LLSFAEQRVRSVAQVLEGSDLAYIAHLAAQVLEEGCEVMAVRGPYIFVVWNAAFRE